ncbi:hypothetical protein [Hymenobacter volaticus]|uniref:Uncharacterized protein n=1 Tax=Hymenobacter volaticus TaxID=2932254 RepID=A0ABY4G5G1_9BACT|nr:hypothetical protein [Hymenobacter volaticus]UOQ66128.1 hypothetical protein MUN86_21955 [Hymenobacter volaticus]
MNNSMNLMEKILRVCSLVMVLGSLLLRLPHIIDAADGHALLTFGLLFSLLSYSSYSRRLRRRNEELERQLEERQPE